MDTNDERLLASIEDQLVVEEVNNSQEIWQKVIQPTRETITVDDLVSEQDYKPISAESFFALAEEVGIEESVEELLAQLD